MTEWMKSILFGLVEGITEWLPISSTGHMILLEEVVSFSMPDTFVELFLIVIQLGAILAVVLLFWKEIWPFATPGNGYVKKDIVVMWFKILTACIPAVLLELFCGDRLEEWFYNYQTVSIMLVVVGVLFLLVENWNQNRTPVASNISDISYKTAFLIGIFQLLAALLPGTSRSGATIIGGLVLGLSRTAAAEFTFYLAIPVMFGASLVKVLQFGTSFTAQEVGVLATGMITAFLVSVFVIRFLMQFIKKHDFKVFGWYRIVLGIVVLAVFSVWG
ncbi:MAG: undecaprenyl-diphosphate phosphatase [Clostridiaceae bacterium]|nr:undecaprenyl-diphosphate phosphatase [Clostridiaceae bacterium]